MFLSSFPSCYNNKICNKIIISYSNSKPSHSFSISYIDTLWIAFQNCIERTYTHTIHTGGLNLTTPSSFRLPKTDEIDMSAIMNDCRKWFRKTQERPRKVSGQNGSGGWREWVDNRHRIAYYIYIIRVHRLKPLCGTPVDPKVDFRRFYLTYSLRKISYYAICMYGWILGIGLYKDIAFSVTLVLHTKQFYVWAILRKIEVNNNKLKKKKFFLGAI